jgi:hypothetical protein
VWGRCVGEERYLVDGRREREREERGEILESATSLRGSRRTIKGGILIRLSTL